jgi:hypothetical protein
MSIYLFMCLYEHIEINVEMYILPYSLQCYIFLNIT